ncbi:hypothetical protein [uncultured Chryseobacterium sp.]|uniref:hypothetical protein n=1 Tax=uncultured Chryseobacterium sp. TaxID=259322 RepID=UPI0025D91AD1|nr:hypothetical protein [uncultured Chryseobacterium sp.]
MSASFKTQLKSGKTITFSLSGKKVRFLSITGVNPIPITLTDLKTLRDCIDRLEEFINDNEGSQLLKKFMILEADRKLYDRSIYEMKFEGLGKNHTREQLTEAIKEAITTGKKRAFIRKLLNLLFAKYKIGIQQGSHLSFKARDLLETLEINFK